MRSATVILVPLDNTPLDRGDPPCYCVGSDSSCAKCRRHRRTRLTLLIIGLILDFIGIILVPFLIRLAFRDASASFAAKTESSTTRGAVDVVACLFMILVYLFVLWGYAWLCVMIVKTLRPKSDVARRIAQLGLFTGPAQDTLDKRWPVSRSRGLPKYTP